MEKLVKQISFWNYKQKSIPKYKNSAEYQSKDLGMENCKKKFNMIIL